MEATIPDTAAAFKAILDVGRRVMLMEPVAADLSTLPMTTPTERVKAVALVLVAAANEHDFIRKEVESSGVMKHLHALARDRSGGEGTTLPTLLEDLPQVTPRENGK